MAKQPIAARRSVSWDEIVLIRVPATSIARVACDRRAISLPKQSGIGVRCRQQRHTQHEQNGETHRGFLVSESRGILVRGVNLPLMKHGTRQRVEQTQHPPFSAPRVFGPVITLPYQATPSTSLDTPGLASKFCRLQREKTNFHDVPIPRHSRRRWPPHD